MSSTHSNNQSHELSTNDHIQQHPPRKRKIKDMISNIIQNNHHLIMENNALRSRSIQQRMLQKQIILQKNWYKKQLDELQLLINQSMDDDFRININPPFKEINDPNNGNNRMEIDKMDQKKETIDPTEDTLMNMNDSMSVPQMRSSPLFEVTHTQNRNHSSLNNDLHTSSTNNKPRETTNTKQQNSKRFGCSYCGKRFNQRQNLKVHIRVHTGGRPFKCKYCPKRFKDSTARINHHLTHTGEKPHECSVCHKKFGQRSSYNRHLRSQTHKQKQRNKHKDNENDSNDNNNNGDNDNEAISSKDPSDFGKYTPNKEMLIHPHHSNSMIYAKIHKSTSSNTECCWVFPAQHQHKQRIIRIDTKYYGLVSTNGAYMNDIIVNFQLKYSYASWPCSFKDKVYLCTSFFWHKLQKNKSDIWRVLGCTKHISLFDKEYIIIPKFESNHWELVIVAHPGKVLNEYLNEDEYDTQNNIRQRPCIVILDSRSWLISSKCYDFELIRNWLNVEATNYIKRNSNDKDKNEDDLDIVFTKQSLIGYRPNVPTQPNVPSEPNVASEPKGSDSACFLLRNMFQFGMDRGFKDTSCIKAIDLSDWYNAKKDGVGYRKEIAMNLDKLIEEQKHI